MTADTAFDPGTKTVAVHSLAADGALADELGTARILTADAAVLAGVATFPLPLVVVAAAEEVEDPSLGRGLPDGRIAFDVIAVHVADDPAGADLSPQPRTALEIAGPAFKGPLVHPARSVWCTLFPRMQACRRR